MGGTYFVQANNGWAFDYDHEENVEKENILIENIRVMLPYEMVRSAINQIVFMQWINEINVALYRRCVMIIQHSGGYGA